MQIRMSGINNISEPTKAERNALQHRVWHECGKSRNPNATDIFPKQILHSQAAVFWSSKKIHLLSNLMELRTTAAA